jgi:hypothetical protein
MSIKNSHQSQHYPIVRDQQQAALTKSSRRNRAASSRCNRKASSRFKIMQLQQSRKQLLL